MNNSEAATVLKAFVVGTYGAGSKIGTAGMVAVKALGEAGRVCVSGRRLGMASGGIQRVAIGIDLLTAFLTTTSMIFASSAAASWRWWSE